MFSSGVVVVLRLFHIGAGVFWVGGVPGLEEVWDAILSSGITSPGSPIQTPASMR